MNDYIVEMRHITKRFPGIIANNDVSVGIRKGECREIHADEHAFRYV